MLKRLKKAPRKAAGVTVKAGRAMMQPNCAAHRTTGCSNRVGYLAQF